MIDYFPFFVSYHEGIKDLPDSERLLIYDAIVNYGLYGNVIENMTQITKLAFEFAKPTLDSSRKRRLINTENGKNGGRPKGSGKKPTGYENENPSVSLEKDMDMDMDREKDREMEKEKTSL